MFFSRLDLDNFPNVLLGDFSRVLTYLLCIFTGSGWRSRRSPVDGWEKGHCILCWEHIPSELLLQKGEWQPGASGFDLFREKKCMILRRRVASFGPLRRYENVFDGAR